MTPNKSPCIEKNCGRCCDPVKVYRGTSVPKDENGNDIWVKKDEILIPESHIDSVKLEVYDCLHFDKDINQCKIYEDRPDICRKTDCVDESKNKSIEEQHQDMISQTFISIKKK